MLASRKDFRQSGLFSKEHGEQVEKEGLTDNLNHHVSGITKRGI